MGVVAGVDQADQKPPAPGQAAQPPTEEAQEQQQPQTPGFAERGRMRRRARYLRRARELAYRDLGGLVFDLHRFGKRNDPVVMAKLATLGQIDTELRALEEALRDRHPVTVLHEVGIAACPRCAAIHGSDDRFCPGCGLAFDAKAERPISTAPVTAAAGATAPSPTQIQAAPTPAPPSQALPARTSPAALPPTASHPRVSEPATSSPERSHEDEPTKILRPPTHDS